MVRIELTPIYFKEPLSPLLIRIFYKTLNAAQLRLKSPLANQYFTKVY